MLQLPEHSFDGDIVDSTAELMATHHDVLGVGPNASPPALRRAFRVALDACCPYAILNGHDPFATINAAGQALQIAINTGQVGVRVEVRDRPPRFPC